MRKTLLLISGFYFLGLSAAAGVLVTAATHQFELPDSIGIGFTIICLTLAFMAFF